jgi:cellulose biosynthesis protein BcsQ
MRSLVLFNNKNGVGKTTLTFHIAHMMAREGVRTVALDCDPQADLTAIFMDESQLEDLWQPGTTASTVARCIDPVRLGNGEVRKPKLLGIAENLWLLPGELSLSRFEQNLAEGWAKKADSNNQRALDVTFALDLLSNLAAQQVDADIVLIDVGPSLGALNRSAILACDHIAVPLAPDLFSLQGLENVGPILRGWRDDIAYVREQRITGRLQENLPTHEFLPIGYIVQQHLARVDRPVSGYAKWADQIPASYVCNVLEGDESKAAATFEVDPNCIFTIKHMSSLAPIAQLARKPMFDLKQADGIGGGQIQAVKRCRDDFRALTRNILSRLDPASSPPASHRSRSAAPAAIG